MLFEMRKDTFSPFLLGKQKKIEKNSKKKSCRKTYFVQCRQVVFREKVAGYAIKHVENQKKSIKKLVEAASSTSWVGWGEGTNVWQNVNNYILLLTVLYDVYINGVYL